MAITKILNGRDFQQITSERLADAEALFASGRFTGAYYLAGYAVECAIKACIATQTKEGDYPHPKGKDFYIHDLSGLRKLANIDPTGDASLEENWSVVIGWSEQSRYDVKSAAQAEGILKAIVDPKDGVLQWLQTQW